MQFSIAVVVFCYIYNNIVNVSLSLNFLSRSDVRNNRLKRKKALKGRRCNTEVSPSAVAIFVDIIQPENLSDNRYIKLMLYASYDNIIYTLIENLA